MDYFDQDKPVDDITLKELDALGEDIFEQKKVVEKIEATLKEANAVLMRLQGQMLSILDRFGKSNYSVAGAGMLIKTERKSVSLPHSPEDKEAFYTYLKQRGIFEDIVSVNSMTLNAFWKREQEIAVEEERSIGFKIPGISEPKSSVTLSIRKSK